MSNLEANKLHVTFSDGTSPEGPMISRRYTLTHSDRTGELFLSVGPEYDRRQIAGWYTRLMRDEVLAEWRFDESKRTYELHVFCHVSGGLVLGSAGWRYGIFQQHMIQVLQAFRYGDRQLFAVYPELDHSEVVIHFQAKQEQYNKEEVWQRIGDYCLDKAL